MPAIPHIDSQDLSRRLAEVNQEFTHMLARRSVSHQALETFGVTLTIFVSMGFLMYWGITKGGSCNWRSKK